MDQITKSAVIKALAVDEGDLTLINAQALRPLTAEDVFTFRVAACDDQVDRDNERFTLACLEGLAKLFVGRPILFDHKWSAEKQSARIYAAAVEEKNGVHRLILRAYMLRGEGTGNTIAAIEGGILREVSVGCAVEKAVCSICGTDKAVAWCDHRPGGEYAGQVCHVDLDVARDAYECSFVAVPAQPGAGVVKQYGGEEAQKAPAAEKTEVPAPGVILALLELENLR